MTTIHENHENPAFIGDDGRYLKDKKNEATNNSSLQSREGEETPESKSKEPPERDNWGNGLEFLMSCIAMSVGLGNVWRFPFTALDNGGGAFLIPYLIVLFLIGKPIYYLEMLIGQFSSRGSVKVFDLCPAMRGVGIGQVVSISMVTTYYVAIMGITLKYLLDSVQSPLPWAECQEEWKDACIASGESTGHVFAASPVLLSNGTLGNVSEVLATKQVTSAELYFLEYREGKVFFAANVSSGHTSVGLGQAFMVFILASYYESICAIIGFYLVGSFSSPLPWAHCRPEWGPNCIDSAPSRDTQNFAPLAYENFTITGNFTERAAERLISSSELYFVNVVLKEKADINDGIGAPNWPLVVGLFCSWLCVFLIIIRGVKSSGKASYFLALFPYIIMGVLLIRAVTLEGSIDGIIYFIKPDWSKILDPKVWYAAVTQCFYSLSVCFGNIIMYSSYNKFRHNIHRDAIIVTSLDTCTSLLAGFTIFGILGHLAHEIGAKDIGSVVKGGAGLAFISYPDAIAKFKQLPQIFSVLFFLMLFILGIGSNIAMTSCTVTAIRDSFPKVKQWQCALGIALVSFCIGLAYVTPGGQFILTLVDYFGASMIALFLGIAELFVLGWVYGVDRLCKDAEFMIGRKVGLYWRLCWSVITPLIMTVILIYFLATYQPLTYNDVLYPNWAYAIGWTITAFGIMQVPIWMCVAIVRHPGATLSEKISGAFRPKHDWGPSDPLLRDQYNKEIDNEYTNTQHLGCWAKVKKNIFG